MASKQIHHHQGDRQPDRNSQQMRSAARPSPTETPLTIAKMTPGTMIDNVRRATPAESALQTPPRVFLQPKLAIGEPGDKYEQEADRMAKEVVQSIHAPVENNGNTLQRQGQSKIPFDATGDRFAPTEIETETLQSQTEAYQQIWGDVLQARGELGGTVNDNFEGELNHAKSGGKPLESKMQDRMGEAFGADFSRVKIHTDSQSHKLNQSIQAKAFTTGKDIFFKAGEYQPESKSGQELIAHELTHVVQQNGSAIQKKEGRETESNESLADSIQRQSEPTIQRFWDATTHVKLPKVAKNIQNAPIYQYTDSGGTRVILNSQSKPVTTYAQEYEMTCDNYVFNAYYTFKPLNSAEWYCIHQHHVTFDSFEVLEIYNSRIEWETTLSLPTEADTILSNEELEQLKEKFLKLGDNKQQFIENVIDSKTGDELKYRLKGYLENGDSLDKPTIDHYANQKIQQAQLAARNLEWETLDITNIGNAQTNYSQLSTGDAKKFRIAIYDAKRSSEAQVTAAVTALHNNRPIGEISSAIASKAREEEWPDLDVGGLPLSSSELAGQARDKYLALNDTEAQKVKLILANLATNEDKATAIAHFVNETKELDTILKESHAVVESSRREGKWNSFNFQLGGSISNNEKMELAKTKYLALKDKQIRIVDVILKEKQKQGTENTVLWALTGVSNDQKFKEKIANQFQNNAIETIKNRIETTYAIELKNDWKLTELEDIEMALQRFQYLLGDLRKVDIGEQSLKEVIRAGQNPDKETQGLTVENQKIYMYNKAHEVKDFVKVTDLPTEEEKRQGFRGTMTHELTHALIADELKETSSYHEEYVEHLEFWETAKKPKFGGRSDEARRKNGKAGGAEVPITDYGAQDAEEDLCEAVMFYFEDRATLRKQCPIRDAWIHQHVIPYLAAPEI